MRRGAGFCLIAALIILVASCSRARAEHTLWMQAADEQYGEGWGLLDLDRLYDSGHWQQQHSVTGDWGGTRQQLYVEGISILGSYEGELDANPAGGRMHKVRYADTLSVAGFLDLGRLFHLDDTYFLASMAERSGSSLSADIPNFFAVQQLYGGETIRLDHPAIEKGFMEGRLDVVAGRLNALDDFAGSSFYCYSQNNGICGNPFSLEANSSLSNYPFASWGIRGRYDVTEDFYPMTGAYNTYDNFADNKYHGVDFSIRHDSGIAIMQEFAYRPQNAREAGYPGFIKVGGFYDSEPKQAFEDGGNISSNWSLYAVAQQRLYRRAGDGFHQGLSGFLTFTYAPPAQNTIEYFADAGLVYRGLFPERERDALGAFALFGEFSPDLRDAQRAAGESVQTQEAILELNYRIAVFAWSYVQPDIQYVVRPDGTGKVSNTLVFAIQAGVSCRESKPPRWSDRAELDLPCF